VSNEWGGAGHEEEAPMSERTFLRLAAASVVAAMVVLAVYITQV